MGIPEEKMAGGLESGYSWFSGKLSDNIR